MRLQIIIGVVFLMISQAYACPSLCSCNSSQEFGTTVDCSARSLQELPSPIPEETSRLILANNTIKNVPWTELALLRYLIYVDLRGNPMDCTCDYLEYWHQNVKPTAARKVEVVGNCTLPNGEASTFKRIDTGAFSNCDAAVVSPSWTVHPVFATSTQKIRPSKTVMAMASSSVAMPTRPPGTPVIQYFNGENRVSIGSELRVTCRASGWPRPNVTLFLQGPSRSIEDWDEGRVVSGSGEAEMTFKADGKSEIRCTAKNEHGEVQSSAWIVVDQTGVQYVMLKVRTVEAELNSAVLDRKSSEFRDLKRRIQEEVASVLKSFSGFISATLVNSGPLVGQMDILIKTFNGSESEVRDALSRELDQAKLGSLKVDRYDNSIADVNEPTPCVAEFVNVTWGEMIAWETTYHKCPRDAKGIAKRNCTAEGYWYYPDYTDCKTAPFEKLKERMRETVSPTAQVQQDMTQEDILSVLRSLVSLTSPRTGEARLAGDLITSVDIIELLVNYNTKQRNGLAYSQQEVKLMVHLASSILHRDNEQELIVAQKVVQMASRLIKYLEIYGMQAVPVLEYNTHGHLEPYIYENVVLGTGVAHPDNISSDIVFPDYDLPELGVVRQAWNASSLVVVDREVIRSLHNKTKEVKLSGLIYRTLQRVFSAESAYSEVGLNYDVNSALLSVSLDPQPDTFIEPVIIAADFISKIDLNGTPPVCAYWDWNINAPHGGWSKEGCQLSTYNTYKTVCYCDHMTNFGILSEYPVSLPAPKTAARVSCAFCSCLFIAFWIIIAWCALTLLVLLILFTCLKPDRTWAMHMCVCASLIVAFALLLVGLDSYNDPVFCNLLSFLAHYFFLCAFSWILTEGVYILTWGSENGPRKSYWIGHFVLGWGLPGIPMLVTWLIAGMTAFESPFSCWMSFVSPMMWVFIASALLISLVSFVIYQAVWKMATGPQRSPLKGVYSKTRFRVHVVYCVVLLFLLFTLWILGILTISFISRGLLCILFVIWCFVTGFLIFWFYCVMDRQVRDAWRSCCCYFRRSRRGRYYPREDSSPSPDEASGQRTSLLVHGSGSIPISSPQDVASLEWQPDEEPLLQQLRQDFEEELPDDPRYQAITDIKLQEEKEDPIYAKVQKTPIKDVASEGDITKSPRDSLTRETVIEMARKSDASKKILARYKSLGSDEQYLDKYHSTYVINQDGFQADLAYVHGKPLDTSTPVRPRVHVTNVYQTFVTVTKGPERPLMQPVEVKIVASPQRRDKPPVTPTLPDESEEFESQTVNVSFEKPPTEEYMPIVEIVLKPKEAETATPAPIVVDLLKPKVSPNPKKNYTVYVNGNAPVEQLEMNDLAPKKTAQRNSRPTPV